MASPSIYWYDFETFGNDPRRDRASQFAGIRTDEALNIIGEPLVMFCKPADDFLPSPGACLVTGITPQQALAEGLHEAQFIERILEEFAQPGTCVAGYNSIRFDDEVTRRLLYRNFFDPYAREWENGNSRWDIIDMVRLCAATRPEGINWPQKEDRSNSFRLQELTRANDIEHADAHDALSDVLATIELAKLIKQKHPRLFNYVFELRDKHKVRAEIDLNTRKPVLHVSVMYPASMGCLALVMPICQHPENSNAVIVYDLRMDPDTWSELSEAELKQRIFTPKQELPEHIERIPLKTIHCNHCPVVTSPAVLSPERAERYGINQDHCRAHWDKLQSRPDIFAKIRKVFQNNRLTPETDPDFMIYSGGFFSRHDRDLMQVVRATAPADLGRLDLPFEDNRVTEMLFRYRARNFPESLADEEQRRWQEFRLGRLTEAEALERYQNDLTQARDEASVEQASVLDQLEQYVETINTI